jgi:DsbC/DsbD-like thiol-disulfide interchange protein
MSRRNSIVTAFVLTLVGAYVLAMSWNRALAQDGGAKKSDSVVKTSAEAAAPDAEGKQNIIVTMLIDPGWHIYANPVDQEDLASVETKITFEAKDKLENTKVDYPAGKVIEDKTVGKYKVYEDKVEIKAQVQRKAGDNGALELTAKFQACTSTHCLLPATVKVKVGGDAGK